MNSQPLVSCIMPTYNRRAFVPQAIEYFLRQDYPNKELVIVDDGTDPVKELIPTDDCMRYIRLAYRATIGEKRNRACEQARGDIIAHWDDDDWQAPQRLRYQVEALLRAGAALCGINTVVGTRPEAIKMAPVIHELAQHADRVVNRVCVTAQHRQMLDQVLSLFRIVPDYDMNLMRSAQSPVQVAAAVLTHLEPIFLTERPDWVLVQGDTTTVMAASIAAFYAGIKIGHVGGWPAHPRQNSAFPRGRKPAHRQRRGRPALCAHDPGAGQSLA